ncbi:hypothetical protein M514_25496 [Trichuris suis]|uniref:Uncharacterized protein n=1 Tax=Trichuris suis TaxID=68888 RepID=A0A085MQB4_9BILA|nr:hypothetical protein M514_28412 [Trichuris suis]KFD62373.1 hypothetical protein M514_25496 [Trichuris suis]
MPHELPHLRLVLPTMNWLAGQAARIHAVDQTEVCLFTPHNMRPLENEWLLFVFEDYERTLNLIPVHGCSCAGVCYR